MGEGDWELSKKTHRTISRRKVVKGGFTALAALAAPAVLPNTAFARTGELRILRWKNFVAASEAWFNDVFVKEWAEANGVNVSVTSVGLGEINERAAAEAREGEGHDLVLFVGPRPVLEDEVIDHGDVIRECENRYGKVSPAVRRSCLNTRTGKYHGFPESFFPTMVTYRKDLWDAVGKAPVSWEDIRKGGRAIRLLHGSPLGISFAPEHNSEHSLRALLNSFGSFVQDENGSVALDNANTVEALNFAKALFEETMTEEVMSWGPPSNNQFMLAGAGNLTIDTMSIIRAAEARDLEVNRHLSLSLLPEGPNGRVGPMFGLNTFVIWKFAKNRENAQKFLVDYMSRYEENSMLGGYQNIAVYPQSAQNLEQFALMENVVPGRYEPLLNVFDTMINLGHPGSSNAAIDEVLAGGFIPRMFSSVVTGQESPDQAVARTVAGIAPIFEKWRDAGKI